MTPLFDANAHPSLSGTLFGKPATFALLSEKLKAAGFVGACAVGLPGKGDYDHARFLAQCRSYPGLVPVAAWHDVAKSRVDREIAELKELGYRAIKVHPRLCGISVRDERFPLTLRAASAAGLVVMFCTYQFGGDPQQPVDILPALLDAIASAPGLRMVFIHGGTVEILRYAEAIRGNPDLLLDVSFTLNRYQGSSIDLDLAYLFRTFDRRMCVGSDFPEYTLDDVRTRFEALTAQLPDSKRENIGWRNIAEFLGVETR